MKSGDKLECLINPTEEQRLEREPLLAFSFYLSGRNNILLHLSDEIIKKLDDGFNDGQRVNGALIEEASTSMWFWLLGAYEVVRTISQAKECFNVEFMTKINSLKRQLAVVRMPSAKMEEQGNPKPVNSNRSPDGWDFKSKDLLVGSPENPKSARQLIKLYDEILCSLTPTEVIKKYEESYKRSINETED